jgi:hypothetical protein
LDENERERFRESARQRVLVHYNLPKNLKSLAELFAAHLPKTDNPALAVEAE